MKKSQSKTKNKISAPSTSLLRGVLTAIAHAISLAKKVKSEATLIAALSLSVNAVQEGMWPASFSMKAFPMPKH